MTSTNAPARAAPDQLRQIGEATFVPSALLRRPYTPITPSDRITLLREMNAVSERLNALLGSDFGLTEVSATGGAHVG